VAHKSAATSLELARKALEDIGAKVDELARKREDRLLAGDDAATIRALDNEMDALEHARRTEVDRIKLLDRKAQQEEAERRVREKEGLIKRLESKLAERDKAGAELQEFVAKAEVAFRRMIAASETVACAWSWNAADFAAGLLTSQSLQGALAREFYRTTARPRLLGGREEKFEVSFPGAACDNHALFGLPKQLPTLAAKLAEATQYCSDLMREKRTTAGPIVVANGNGSTIDATPAAPRLPEPGELSALLAQQARLALDTSPEGEAKYQEIVRQIAALQ